MLGRRTNGTASGSSLLPTPVATYYSSNRSDSPNAAVREGLEAMATRGSWPTAKASDGEKMSLGHRGAADTLTSAVRLFPTPDAGMAERGTGSKPEERRASGHSVTLQDAVAWPTATVCGNHNRKGASPTSGDGLATAVSASYPTPTARDSRDDGGAPSAQNRKTPCLPAVVAQKGQLNPDWVEALMGWPIGWTGLPHKARGPLDEEQINTDGSRLVFFPEEVGSRTDGSASKPSAMDKSQPASSPRGGSSSLERPRSNE